VGQTLTANTDALEGSGTITYKWQHSDTADGSFADISGAAANTYILAPADAGKFIRVEVSRAGYTGTKIGETAGAVASPLLTGLVTVSGTVRVGQTLTANTAALEGSGTITYKWQRSDTADGSFVDISGAAANTYILATADAGKFIRVEVSRAGYEGTVSSESAGPVIPLSSININIGFNYGPITIGGDNGDNTIYRTTPGPRSLTLTASADYEDVVWYVNTANTTLTGNSVTLNAVDYGVKVHEITFTGKHTGNDMRYSQNISFTVKH
jgi:hypothetical protein